MTRQPSSPDKIGALLKVAGKRLLACGIDTAELDARLLLARVLDCAAMDIYLQLDRDLTPAQQEEFTRLLERRLKREPISRIRGEKEFWSLNFRVTGDVLTPRPDSETLIEVTLGKVSDKSAPLRLLDLGTGSGCLLLSLLSELPHARGIGLDISEPALQVARENAESLGFSDRAEFRRSDWTDDLEPGQKFDIIISNPPYIGLAEKESLPPEVRNYEPEGALFAGEDGLDDYRRLIGQIPAFLAPGGFVLFEIGAGQGEALRQLLSGAALVEIHRDLAGLDRCVLWIP